MRHGFAAFVGIAGLAVSAQAGYTVNSRYSEWTQENFDTSSPPPANQFYSTTSLGSFVVPGLGAGAARHSSNLTASGATYSAHTNGLTTTAPPNGGGNRGYFSGSRFEMVFTITEAANFTLVGVLEHIQGTPVTLKLEALSVGGSPTYAFVATNTFPPYPPDSVNWSGTLLAGQYKLSIVEGGIRAWGGASIWGTNSNFTFSIPSPGTAGVLLALAAPVLRRRRG